MTIARTGHTATLLSDGRVLVAGGERDLDPVATAELFGPTEGTFIQVGPMSSRLTVGRTWCRTTRLQDGRVLVTGGEGPSFGDPVASTEVFDPASGMFIAAGDMSVARRGHTATILDDGRVLLAGGDDVDYERTATADLFDPATGTISPTGPMGVPRADHAAVRLTDGRVLVVGGWDEQGEPSATAEIYDPATGTFSPTGRMTAARSAPAAVLLRDGRVLVAGEDDDRPLRTVELWDPATGRFTAGRVSRNEPIGDLAVGLVDGRILLTNGASNAALILDPATGRVTGPRVRLGLRLAVAERLADGRVLLIGNRRAGVFDPATGGMTTTDDLVVPREGHSATLLADGRVLVACGHGDSAELYAPDKGRFEDVSVTPGSAGHAGTVTH